MYQEYSHQMRELSFVNKIDSRLWESQYNKIMKS